MTDQKNNYVQNIALTVALTALIKALHDKDILPSYDYFSSLDEAIETLELLEPDSDVLSEVKSMRGSIARALTPRSVKS